MPTSRSIGSSSSKSPATSCPKAIDTPENLVATGYYRLGPWDDEPADPKQDRYDQLDDLVNTTSEVFLGLTLGCARCHNHKFEPLSMHDYYRMVAIFEPLQRPANGRPERTLPIGTRAQIAADARKLTRAISCTSPRHSRRSVACCTGVRRPHLAPQSAPAFRP